MEQYKKLRKPSKKKIEWLDEEIRICQACLDMMRNWPSLYKEPVDFFTKEDICADLANYIVERQGKDNTFDFRTMLREAA
ncbi:hypothetical protein [Beijerinckia mobilis]|uniref:hypothetical protein n=1 Tax=Beijerinckia mobilis TaxID=231434 RepID=UPI000554EF2E|nr:hypothetical protein [Beijerinckia mobilis]